MYFKLQIFNFFMQWMDEKIVISIYNIIKTFEKYIVPS